MKKLENPEQLENRKADHIELALKSQVQMAQIDNRFYYEPLLSGHVNELPNTKFLGKNLSTPIWVSSMTGGTEMAHFINHNLAKACLKFGMGMGLGSCRPLLESNERFEDFNLRPLMGNDLPLFANLGVAQIEEILASGRIEKIANLVSDLEADGLIVHVNPLQEWLQPEGDRFTKAPIITISELINKLDLQVIVKEVGQGMGRASLKSLLQMPLAAIDFGAHGGTNFAKLEMRRNTDLQRKHYQETANIGHSANEMVNMVNELVGELGNQVMCKEIIVSGGVKNFLDGYYHTSKLKLNSVYGQASALLKPAREGFEPLVEYLNLQIEGLKMAHSFLRVKV
ncbi:MAG: isopentenyl-diphosphate delta-isomerase [Bacteroidetes bacterium]|nr:isopentenyl-diphosphate delta-isomerase [Bacteroidota bacterium]